jgi:hypothetical protein
VVSPIVWLRLRYLDFSNIFNLYFGALDRSPPAWLAYEGLALSFASQFGVCCNVFIQIDVV